MTTPSAAPRPSEPVEPPGPPGPIEALVRAEEQRAAALEPPAGFAHAAQFDDPTELLTEEVETPSVRAMEVLRRGLAVSPELRAGIAFTLGMAIFTAVGRLVTPVLIQQILDKGVTGSEGFRPGFVLGASGAALVVTVLVIVLSRATYIRLVRSAEAMLCNLRVRAFAHVHRAEHRRPQRVEAGRARRPGHQRRRDHRPVRPVGWGGLDRRRGRSSSAPSP